MQPSAVKDFGKRLGADRLYWNTLNALPDELAISWQFLRAHKRLPDLKRPKTLNEKVCWRKLHQHNPDFTAFADKVEAKRRVGALIGDEYIIPNLWVGGVPEEIPFDDLPTPYIIKPNHSSGRNLFVYDANAIDRRKTVAYMKEQIQLDYGHRFREWAYRGISRKILIEPIIYGENIAENPVEYKFFTYHGKVRFIKNNFDRFTNLRHVIFDRDWNKLPAQLQTQNLDKTPPPPPHLDLMMALAEKIGSQFDFVRVDFYDLPEGPRFSETTFYPGSGLEVFSPTQWDLRFGEPWRLPD